MFVYLFFLISRSLRSRRLEGWATGLMVRDGASASSPRG
jgi:hypothetical protein